MSSRRGKWRWISTWLVASMSKMIDDLGANTDVQITEEN
jgi:hypothetical protein